MNDCDKEHIWRYIAYKWTAIAVNGRIGFDLWMKQVIVGHLNTSCFIRGIETIRNTVIFTCLPNN